MLYFILAGIIVLADQLFKYWVSLNIAVGEQLMLVPGVIHLTQVHNTGAAFGILSGAGMRWILVGIMSVGVIVLVVFLIKYRMGTLGRVAVAMVLGGAIGNLVDRIALGYVVDMFEVEFMNFAVFNVADCFITIGGLIFIVYFIVYNVQLARHEKEKLARKMEAEKASTERLNKEWTEDEILEEFHMEQLMTEDNIDDEA